MHYLCLAAVYFVPTSIASCKTPGILPSPLNKGVLRIAPGAQSAFDRWSVVFFSRPGDSVKLRALTELSPIIAKAVSEAPEKNFNPESTSLEWFTRRVKNQRINNRKVTRSFDCDCVVHEFKQGPETWIASRGTEHVDDTIVVN